jgi:cyanophycinase
MEAASAVWISADQTDKATLLSEDRLMSGLLGVLQRQGTVALESHLVNGIGERLLPGMLPVVAGSLECSTASDEPSAPALSADSLSFEQRLSFLPDRVGLRLEGSAGVLVDGRQLSVLGDGEVSLHFAATPYFSAQTKPLEGRRRHADLLALRRYASARLASGFPHTGAELPLLENGSLMIVGGGGMPRGALRRFVELAGGEEASIVVIPISMPDPLPEQDRIVDQFRKLGAKQVAVLRGRTPADVDDAESLETLRQATGIWFGGGRQWRFVDAYEGTEAERLIRDVLARGGVIGGSSAGASIQADYLVRGNPLGPQEIIAEGYEQGMKFLPGVAIDQHFTQRDRHSDLQQLVLHYPALLGIGIDEATMLVVRGSTAEVQGENHVYFFDPAEVNSGGAPVKLGDGAWYDLVGRRPLGQASQAP